VHSPRNRTSPSEAGGSGLFDWLSTGNRLKGRRLGRLGMTTYADPNWNLRVLVSPELGVDSPVFAHDFCETCHIRDSPYRSEQTSLLLPMLARSGGGEGRQFYAAIWAFRQGVR
jgi:hypothetical protein